VRLDSHFSQRFSSPPLWVAGGNLNLNRYPPLPLQMYIIYCLFALPDEDSSFSIKLDRTNSVDDLKGAIKSKNMATLAGVDAKDLKLYCVNIPFDISGQKKHVKQANDACQGLSPLQEWNELSEIGIGFPRGTLHILVQLPPSEHLHVQDALLNPKVSTAGGYPTPLASHSHPRSSSFGQAPTATTYSAPLPFQPHNVDHHAHAYAHAYADADADAQWERPVPQRAHPSPKIAARIPQAPAVCGEDEEGEGEEELLRRIRLLGIATRPTPPIVPNNGNGNGNGDGNGNGSKALDFRAAALAVGDAATASTAAAPRNNPHNKSRSIGVGVGAGAGSAGQAAAWPPTAHGHSHGDGHARASSVVVGGSGSGSGHMNAIPNGPTTTTIGNHNRSRSSLSSTHSHSPSPSSPSSHSHSRSHSRPEHPNTHQSQQSQKAYAHDPHRRPRPTDWILSPETPAARAAKDAKFAQMVALGLAKGRTKAGWAQARRPGKRDRDAAKRRLLADAGGAGAGVVGVGGGEGRAVVADGERVEASAAVAA
jgi:hypothetical protein